MADSRVSVLTRVAELYTELVDPMSGPAGIRGDGDSIGFMPPTYSATVREYERLVRLMRDDRHEPLIELNGAKVSVRSLWWHLEMWHHRAVRVIRNHPVTTKQGGRLVTLMNPGNPPTPVTRPTIAYLRDPKADRVRAERAIQFISARWDHKRIGEPMLPAQVVEGFKVAA